LALMGENRAEKEGDAGEKEIIKRRETKSND
jgi:hypothetical protein